MDKVYGLWGSFKTPAVLEKKTAVELEELRARMLTSSPDIDQRDFFLRKAI